MQLYGDYNKPIVRIPDPLLKKQPGNPAPPGMYKTLQMMG